MGTAADRQAKALEKAARRWGVAGVVDCRGTKTGKTAVVIGPELLAAAMVALIKDACPTLRWQQESYQAVKPPTDK
jgi:hypothetical protein